MRSASHPKTNDAIKETERKTCKVEDEKPFSLCLVLLQECVKKPEDMLLSLFSLTFDACIIHYNILNGISMFFFSLSLLRGFLL